MKNLGLVFGLFSLMATPVFADSSTSPPGTGTGMGPGSTDNGTTDTWDRNETEGMDAGSTKSTPHKHRKHRRYSRGSTNSGSSAPSASGSSSDQGM